MEDEFDFSDDWSNDECWPICPHCKREEIEPEELELETDVVQVINCRFCGSAYNVLPSTYVSYITKKLSTQ
jgi:hypothetical protein